MIMFQAIKAKSESIRYSLSPSWYQKSIKSCQTESYITKISQNFTYTSNNLYNIWNDSQYFYSDYLPFGVLNIIKVIHLQVIY